MIGENVVPYVYLLFLLPGTRIEGRVLCGLIEIWFVRTGSVRKEEQVPGYLPEITKDLQEAG